MFFRSSAGASSATGDSKQSETGREGEDRSEPVRVAAALSPEQVAARDRWQRRWNVPILLAALLPLFLSSPKSRFVEVFVGVGSWLVFVVDLFVQLRIDRSYLRRGPASSTSSSCS